MPVCTADQYPACPLRKALGTVCRILALANLGMKRPALFYSIGFYVVQNLFYLQTGGRRLD